MTHSYLLLADLSSFCLIADIEGFFGIVFFLIAFVGWVINIVNQNQQQNKPGQRRRPPNQAAQRRKQEVQHEIDKFLNRSRDDRRREEPVDLDEVEVIAPPPTRRAPPRKRRTREEVWAEQTGNRPQSETPSPTQQKSRQSKRSGPKPRKGLASRHLKTSEPEKPKKFQKKRPSLAEQVEKDLPHAVDASVSSHMSTFTADQPQAVGQQGISRTTSDRKSEGNLIGQLLKSKQGIRNAIILNEILSPPKAMRNK